MYGARCVVISFLPQPQLDQPAVHVFGSPGLSPHHRGSFALSRAWEVALKARRAEALAGAVDRLGGAGLYRYGT